MNLKTSSSKICVLLAILFFINPVMVTADVLFSAIYSKSVSLAVSTEVLSTASSEVTTCHDEMNGDAAIKQIVDNPDMESDCCADVCLCDDAGCHTTSLVFQFNSNISFNFQQDHLYHLPIYLSLAFTPSSPPPIV
ncbi:MAG: hypothetical protein ACI8O8_002309 [Oleiphilaceae bacterium]|jgi:hypothetical protein